MTKPFELSAFEARQLIGQKKLSSLELVKSCIGQIEKTNTKIIFLNYELRNSFNFSIEDFE